MNTTAMTTAASTTAHHTPRSAATDAGPARRHLGLGLFLAAEALLSFAPLAVLAPAIGWPASLGNPAAEQLAAIGAAPDAVTLGYTLYLLYSVLIAPLMILLAARTFGGFQSATAVTVAAFGALSALARCIGILRWLTAMPALAAAHAAADPATRSTIETVFTAITAYGGGIGELLGVSLFMALSMLALCIGGWRSGGMPRWLAGFGAVSALLLAAMPLQMPVAVAVTVLSLWMFAAAAWCLRGQRQPTLSSGAVNHAGTA